MTIDFDITWAQAAVIAATAFVAGLMRGFAGFGSALTIVPVTSAVAGPLVAVPAVVLMHIVTGAQLLPGALRAVDWGRAWPLSLAGVAAVPVGAWLLVSQDPEHIRRGISLLIIVFAVLMLRGWRYTGRINNWVTTAVGGTGGVISGAAMIGGPPVVMFLLAGPHRAAQNRGTIIMYFQFTQLAAIAMYWIEGILVWDIVWLALLTAPPLMLGMLGGQWLFGRASDEAFRRVALLFLLAVGVTTLAI